MGVISVLQLGIVAVIVVLLFGTKKLRDLGSAVKGFKSAMGEEEPSIPQTEKSIDILVDNNPLENKVSHE